MVASLNKATLPPQSATKIYTNSGTTDVIATLNIVSQTATKNPKVNVAYSSDATLVLNGDYPASWSLSSASGTGSNICLVSLSTSTSTKGKTPFAMNVTDGTWGTIKNHTGTGVSSSQYTSQFIDPYFLVSPTSYNSDFTTPPYATHYSSGIQFWKDFNVAMEGTPSLAKLFGVDTSTTDPDYSTDYDLGYSGGSYYSDGAAWDMYKMIGLSANTSGYMTIRHLYTNDQTFDGTSWTGEDGNRTSNGAIYDQVSGSWGSFRPQQADCPWTRSMSCDNGMFVADTSGHSSKCFILFNFNPHITNFTSSSSIDSRIAQNRGIRVKTTGQHDFRWIKYNPHTLKWYICIGGTGSSQGLYSFDRVGEYYNSDTGNGQFIEQIAMFTKEESFNFPEEKMTLPARIASSLWLSYTSAGDAYYSSDLITWTIATTHDSKMPSDAHMKNVGPDGVTYYGLRGTTTVKIVTSGYSGVDKAGWIEASTEVGRYERAGLIIPKGQSIYVENADAETSVSASLLTMDI